MAAARGTGLVFARSGAEVMGEEGHSYRKILNFYYPGTRLGVSAQGIPWQQLANEDVTLLTTLPDRDRPLSNLGHEVRTRVRRKHWTGLSRSPRLKVYPTVAAFRNSTGEPGWVAASTRGTHHPDATFQRIARDRHTGEHNPSRAFAHADRFVRAAGNTAVVS